MSNAVYSSYWERNEDRLKEYFANSRSFANWLGKNEKNLPFGYSLEQLVRFRARQLCL